jgi:vesicle-associated membrane protein 72
MSSTKQALIYNFVAKGFTMLAEHTNNFSTVVVQCFQKLPPNSTRSTYSWDGHTFNFLVHLDFGTSRLSHLVSLL